MLAFSLHLSPSLTQSHFSSRAVEDRPGFLACIPNPPALSLYHPHFLPVHCPPPPPPPHGLGTYIELGVPQLSWPAAATKSTGKLRLSFDIFIPAPSPDSRPLRSILSPLSQLPVGWALERLMRTSEDGVVSSFRRTLCGRVFRPDWAWEGRSTGCSEDAFVPVSRLECAASNIPVLAIEPPTHPPNTSSQRNTETTTLLLSLKILLRTPYQWVPINKLSQLKEQKLAPVLNTSSLWPWLTPHSQAWSYLTSIVLSITWSDSSSSLPQEAVEGWGNEHPQFKEF